MSYQINASDAPHADSPANTAGEKIINSPGSEIGENVHAHALRFRCPAKMLFSQSLTIHKFSHAR